MKRTIRWALFIDVALLLVLQPYRPVLVVGESMQPTFHSLQLVIAKPLLSPPNRGDVVVFDWSDEQLIKRVAGLPNDSGMPGQPPRARVPSDHFFLLGDNAPVSVDSRTFGALPEKDLKMVVVFPATGPGSS